ncbi:MAG: hypothetical protein IPG60_16435 [Bacteroidetes bacterium]|nr:hypothetical protein [Bacteroidota bacterium]
MYLDEVIRNGLINYKGFRTTRKIVVIESDDWGSIRMPSIKAFKQLQSMGVEVEKNPYCRFDSLESNVDMEQLFNILIKHKDAKDNHPVITANVVMANPDFKKINDSNFKRYYYEPFTETLKRYALSERVMEYYSAGIASKLFYPQFHGREHVNVEYWLKLLCEEDGVFRKAFNLELWGLGKEILPWLSNNIQATYDTLNHDLCKESILTGLDLFYKVFSFNSKSFIANNYIWSVALNEVLASKGVVYLQGMKFQILPMKTGERRKYCRHFLGQINRNGQTYGIRNCFFEPALTGLGHENTLKEIALSFFWKKPAIICSHRLNFMGSLNTQNRENNLIEFNSLIKKY